MLMHANTNRHLRRERKDRNKRGGTDLLALVREGPGENDGEEGGDQGNEVADDGGEEENQERNCNLRAG